MEYPVFAPPLDLAIIKPKDWSKLQVKTYFDWFLSVIESRVDNFLSFLNLERTTDNIVLLEKAQEKCEILLLKNKFFQTLPSGSKLNNQGYALAADLGLLIATLLIQHGQGKVSWHILKKGKTSISYNLPVLVGFDFGFYDPIGGSIADTAWITKGNTNPKAWVKAFEFWAAKIL